MITGWINTDAKILSIAQKCLELAGNQCKIPSGRLRNKPHGERVKFYIGSMSRNEFEKDYRKTILTNNPLKEIVDSCNMSSANL